MRKSMILMFLFCMSFLLISCDGLNSTSELTLKSVLDGHETTIKVRSRVKGYNFGSILWPYSGKSKFNTKISRDLEVLETELRVNNHHIEIQRIGNDIISILEIAEDQRIYSYFIKNLGIVDNRNHFIIGEQRFDINLGDGEYKLVILPCHYLNDMIFDRYINQYDSIKANEDYLLRENHTIDDFNNFYLKTGWTTIEKDGNKLIISGLNQRIEDPQKPYFFDTFTLSFENEGYVTIYI